MSILLVTFSATLYLERREKENKTKSSYPVTESQGYVAVYKGYIYKLLLLSYLLHRALLFSSIFSPYVYISLQSF